MIGTPCHKPPPLGLISLVVVLLAGCAHDHTDPGRPTAARMKITPIGEQSKDRIAVEIEIRNEGKTPFVWDSEFSVFMRWSVTTDSGQCLEPQGISDVEDEPTDNRESRFVTIAPGQSLSKRVELTRAFRKFIYGYGLIIPDKGDPYTIPNAYQELARFAIPEDVKSVRVQVQYEGISLPGAESFASFMLEFGVNPVKVGLLDEGLRSNELQISLVARAP